MVMGGATPTPVPNAWVTLHRVAQDSSGPIDSLRTDARGAFTFRYRPFGSGDAIYFVSTRRGGVAYFTPPLREAMVRGENAEIDVFDTTSARVPTTVRGRHLIVAAPDASGARSVIEVFELSNDSSLTAIEREGTTTGVWSTAVPAGAQRFEVRAGEIPSDALVLDRGRAVLRLPLAPGLKQIAFSYVLPGDAFPINVVSEGPTTVLEVLLEDPRGTATGSRIVGVEPALVEGRSFRRFLAQDVPSGGRVVVDVPPVQPAWMRWAVSIVLVAVGLAMIGALTWSWRRRQSRVVAPPMRSARPAAVSADALAHEIAALDDAFDAQPSPSDAARAEHTRRRDELKSRLAAALARQSTLR
jgi:hypothetical protein